MKGRNWILDLIFPRKCTFCAEIMEHPGDLMCPDCQRTLPWLLGARAEKQVEFVETCVSALRYHERVKQSVHRFKFRGRRWYAQTYGVLTAQSVQDHLSGTYDVISWVPVSKKRKRERGYDQSFLLASEMGKHLGQEPVELLQKVRHNPAQSGLTGAAQRRANVMDAYQAPWPERLAGKRVLLVDDVVTTGETLSECARTLRMAGAESVVCVTLAQARGEPDDLAKRC